MYGYHLFDQVTNNLWIVLSEGRKAEVKRHTQTQTEQMGSFTGMQGLLNLFFQSLNHSGRRGTRATGEMFTETEGDVN